MRFYFSKRFGLMLLLALMVSLLSAQLIAQANDKTAKQTFVIVHGATGGGWDWRTVADLLVQQGHTVYRPTLTGLGDRNHLANDKVNLTTHITDVSNLILFEKLQKVVLVGHSYGGMVISGVANRLPERIAHLTFLDAAVPAHDMSALDVWGTKVGDLEIINGLVNFSWLKDTEEVPRDVPQPINTLTEPVAFDNPAVLKLNASYVAFLPQDISREERSKDPSWQRSEARGWTIRTFAGDHVVYRVKPKEFVSMLLKTVTDRNTEVVQEPASDPSEE
jgi:pimeloyl-ACP methyl ester carboxylesterase